MTMPSSKLTAHCCTSVFEELKEKTETEERERTSVCNSEGDDSKTIRKIKTKQEIWMQ